MTDKVVCIRDDFKLGPLAGPFPRKGRIYTVVRSFEAHGTTWLNLGEIHTVGPFDEVAFDSTWFRPVTKRKTDISVFTRLLVPGTKILEYA